MEQAAFALRWEPRRHRWAGAAARMLVVVAAHGAAVFGLAQLHPQLRNQLEPIFVRLITPPPPEQERVPAPQPLPPKPASEPRRIKPTPKRVAHPVRAAAAVIARAPVTPAETPQSGAPDKTSLTVSEQTISHGEPPPKSAATAASVQGAHEPPLPVVAPRFDVAYLDNPRPEYPRIARRLGEHGRVVLRVFVSPAGRAEQVEIRTSSGYPRLDQAARDAVRNWQFVPARQGDKPVGAWVLVPISFVLQG